MPSAKSKRIEAALPAIQAAYREAFANPGRAVVVLEDAPLAESKRMHVKLAAVRNGFVMFLPPSDERRQATVNGCLHIRKVWDKRKPYTRTVTLLYEGRVRPPSELVGDYLRSLEGWGSL